MKVGNLMQLSETIKLYPTSYQKELILLTMNEYISTVNSLVSDAVNGVIDIKHLTSANINTNLPSAIKNQCIRDTKSIINKYYKNCHKAVLKNRFLIKKKLAPQLSIVKKPCCYINNQNFKINGSNLEFPMFINDRCTRISVSTKLTDEQLEKLNNSKLGTMRIVIKNNTLVAQIPYEEQEQLPFMDGHIMGVDLGIKCPAVSYSTDGSVKFYGNGRKNKYIRRQYAHLRKKLQKAKNIKTIKRINDKEQRIMKDIDHKISRQIINTALEHNVKLIKLEQLTNIRSTTRTSRKNNHSLHNWSFYRLAQFIEYKAALVGITVEYVNPAYTSQSCPNCGSVHHANDRNYKCRCGFHMHRDLLGAMNICNSTEYVGHRHTA